MSELDATSLAVMQLYESAPWHVRWHVRTRMRLCPYEQIVTKLPASGSILDVGCGYGHFCWYLAFARPGVSVVGCDLDGRKVAAARAAQATGSVRAPEFHLGRVEDVASKDSHFAGITILDVLYLLSVDSQRALVEWCAQRISPGGTLVIKALDTRSRWRAKRALMEEWIMVRLLRKTTSSSRRFEARAPQEYGEWLGALGLKPQVKRLKTMNPSALIWGVK